MKHYRDIGNTAIHFERHTNDSIVSETLVSEGKMAYVLPEAAKRVTIVQTRLKDALIEGAIYLEELR